MQKERDEKSGWHKYREREREREVLFCSQKVEEKNHKLHKTKAIKRQQYFHN